MKRTVSLAVVGLIFLGLGILLTISVLAFTNADPIDVEAIGPILVAIIGGVVAIASALVKHDSDDAS